MTTKKHSRKILTLGAAVLVGAGLVYAFWPQPALVDVVSVTRGKMVLTINEEARTRVRDTYVVSSPIAGHLLRVDAEPGDVVERGQTVVARIVPSSPPALDARQREQARAGVESAQAALRMAQADVKAARADNTLAEANLTRATEQRDKQTISQADFEQAQMQRETALATFDGARAQIALRQAELANAQAVLIRVDDLESDDGDNTIEIRSPVDGRVLRVRQESEAVLLAGTAILEIGDVEQDLEIIVELLSTDAVQISPGDRVIIRGWGGVQELSGEVERIDPFAFTKFSALGVEEQRVNAIIQSGDLNRPGVKLGHGFRVEVQIVVWESDDAIIIPSGALFRHNGQWSVFGVEQDRVALKTIEVGRDNGTIASVVAGLKPDDRVVFYPAAELKDGARIAARQNNN